MKFWHAVACLLLALCAGDVCYATDPFSQHDDNNKNINKESRTSYDSSKNYEILPNTQTWMGNNLNFRDHGASNSGDNPLNTGSMMSRNTASTFGKVQGRFGGQIQAFFLQMEQLTRKCADLQERVAELTTSKKYLDGTLEEYKKEIRELKNNIEKLNRENEDSLRTIAQDNIIIGTKKQMDQEISELNESIKKKDEEIVVLNNTIKGLEKQVSDKEKTSAEYNIRLDNVNTTNDKLEQRNKSLEEEIRTLQGEVQNLKEQKQQSDLKLEKITVECNVANEKLGKSGEEKEALRNEKQGVAEELEKVKDNYLEQLNQLKMTSQKDQSEIASLEKEKERLSEEKERLSEEKERLHEKYQNLKKDNQENEGRIRELEKELAAYKQLDIECQRLKEENQKLSTENETFRADFNEWEAVASSFLRQDPNLGTVPPDYNAFDYSVKIPKEYELNTTSGFDQNDLMQEEQETPQNDDDTSGAAARPETNDAPFGSESRPFGDHPSSNENTSQSPSNAEDKTKKNES